MGRESIEEGELSTPLVAKEEHHQLYGSDASSGDHACANTTGCDDGGESQSGSSSATGVVVLSTLVAISGSYVFGTAVGYSSPAQSGITDDLGLTVVEYSLFGSILTIGAMIGAIVSGQIADYIGRRGTMGFSEIFCLAGWLAIAFSKGAWWLDLGRLLVGCGMGLFSYVVPIYIAEITPKNLRGGFTTVHQLMICCGVSLTYLIGAFVNWRTLALIGTIPCLVQLLGLFFIPESPRWLVGVGLMVLQQFGGVNGIAFYASAIFITAGFSGSIGTIAMVIVQIPMTALGVILMDKSGRRPLLLVSAAGTCLGCLLVGLSFFLQDLQTWTKTTPILALIGVLVYTGSFSLGMGGIPWVIMSEIFPINMKGSAGSLVTLVSWLGSWIVSYAFNFLMDWSSTGNAKLVLSLNIVVILDANCNMITLAFNLCLPFVRNILHILKHMWLNCFVRSKVGTRDQGANT
ncbi:sugar transporter ERD6-like 5 isoform X9 [Quercus robur]|uniref:sugar transporter ERD6-like 5 isoform X9 n=1 Tax=Quercus robur TaxID=38942 RepID=UPI002161D907|nr:sugar transporter ERD6-like 5 isoform X9 [Quercus robur]